MKYDDSIAQMQNLVNNAVLSDTPHDLSEVRVLYTPHGYVQAGHDLMSPHSTQNTPQPTVQPFLGNQPKT